LHQGHRINKIILDRSLFVSGLVVGAAALTAVFVAFLAITHLRAVRRSRKYRLLGELASEVNRAILFNEDEEIIFSTILDYAFRILEKVNLGSVLSFDPNGYLVIIASHGFDPDFVRNFRLRLEDTFQYRQSGGNISQAMIIEPEIIKGFADKLDSEGREYKSIISAPLFVGGRLYGFLNVDSVHAKRFGPADLALLKNLSGQIEVCLLARTRYRSSLAESRTDALTGLLTRGYFEELGAHAVKHATRYDLALTFGMYDLDGLKQVNDGLGHPAGDLLLVAAAKAISGTARKSDIFGRYGGDEFIAVHYNTDAKEMTERSLEKLKELRAAPLSFGGKEIAPSFSFGFADFPADAQDVAGLISVADARLYAMKSERKREADRKDKKAPAPKPAEERDHLPRGSVS